jgi:hypothetical protein
MNGAIIRVCPAAPDIAATREHSPFALAGEGAVLFLRGAYGSGRTMGKKITVAGPAAVRSKMAV